ncbi:alpha/beta hydrolase [Sphingosinicellaceae bacterium]|nr:alpha/beta hydrolase [Sphingosinicellaceae bacterium]
MALFAEVCGDDRERLARALAGVRAYQAHPYRRASAPLPEIARVGSVALRDYADGTRGGAGRTVVVVPSLINPPTVLDLAEGNSLLRWLAGQGVRPLLVDWGTPGTEELGFGVGEMVSERLVPLLRAAGSAALVGYCMGGTMAVAAATLTPVRRLALLATPWHFGRYDAPQRTGIGEYAAAIRPLASTLGAVPMDLLQPAFWRLGPEGVVAKFEAFGARDPASPAAAAFVALEDWANDGPPLALRVATELFDDLFAADLSGRAEWQVGGCAIRPRELDIPILDVVAMRDRIVPATSALGLGTRLDIDGGHVGMVVGSRARETLWEPLARFLRED